MLAIVGLGFAEVKYQAHGGDFVGVSEQSTVSGVGNVSSNTSGVDTVAAPTSNTVGAGLTQAAAKVSGAYTGKWDDDGDEGEDGDDDGDEGENRNTSSTVTTQPVPAKPTPTTSAPAPTTAGTFTLAQVATHNNSASCYSAINGGVYDLTSFITQHPGGVAAIKSLCGVDGTSAYNGQHGSSRRPANELASLKIGVLAQ